MAFAELQKNHEPYLCKLHTYSKDQLKREKIQLSDKTAKIVKEKLDLAISNYNKFIETAENLRTLNLDLQTAEEQVRSINAELPSLIQKCQNFYNESHRINSAYYRNSKALRGIFHMQEVLQLSVLMERCIYEDIYEEVLEIAKCVQKLERKKRDIAIIQTLATEVNSLWHLMVLRLLSHLRTDLQLPKCLQIISFLRRIEIFGLEELKLKFLKARGYWLTSLLSAIPIYDAQHHLAKTIEITRINLFNIITQYAAIFPDEMASPISVKSLHESKFNGLNILSAWLHQKIKDFLCVLESDLNRGITSIDILLGQCMYFGLSFSRVYTDFRGLMVPIFLQAIRKKFRSSIESVGYTFEKDLKYYASQKDCYFHKLTKESGMKHTVQPIEGYALPPESLLNYPPLALLCNGFLKALNDLRHCAPMALAPDIIHVSQHSLQRAAEATMSLQQPFKDCDCFRKLCSSFACDLVPYMQSCITVIYAEQILAKCLGTGSLMLKKEQINYFEDKFLWTQSSQSFANIFESVLLENTDVSAVESLKV